MPITMSKASVSCTLQCWGTCSLPRHTVTSTPPREWMVLPCPTGMATVLVCRILACLSNLQATMESVRVQDNFVNLITYFDGDPENEILILGAAPLCLSRELHFQPGSLLALAVPVEHALLGVTLLFGAVRDEAGGDILFFTLLVTLRCRFGCSSSTSSGGVRTFILHQGYPYPYLGSPQGSGLPARGYPFRRSFTAPLPLS